MPTGDGERIARLEERTAGLVDSVAEIKRTHTDCELALRGECDAVRREYRKDLADAKRELRAEVKIGAQAAERAEALLRKHLEPSAWKAVVPHAVSGLLTLLFAAVLWWALTGEPKP